MDDVKVKITGDSSGLTDALDQSGDKTESLGKKVTKFGKESALGYAGLSAAILGSVYAFGEQEKVNNRVNSIIASTGGIAGVTAAQINELADKYADLTEYSATAIKASEGILVSYTNIGKETFPNATAAAIKLAQVTGVDLPTAANIVGKALDNPMNATRALREAHIQLTQAQQAQIREMQLSGNVAGAQAIILDALGTKLGGLNPQALTVAGTFKQLANKAEEIAIAMGQELAPVVLQATAVLKDLLEYIRDNPAFIRLAAGVLLGTTAVAGIVAGLAAAAAVFVKITEVIKLATATIEFFGIAGRIAMGATGIGLLIAVGAAVYEYWGQIWPAMQGAFQVFVTTITQAAQGLGKVLKGIFTLDPALIKEGVIQAAAAFSDAAKTAMAAIKPRRLNVVDIPDDSAADSAYQKARQQGLKLRAEERQLNADLAASQKAANKATELELTGHTKAVVDLKKQESEILKQLANAEYQGDKNLLRKHLEEVRAEELKAQATEQKQIQTFNKLKLADEANLTQAQKTALIAKIQTQETAEQQFYTEELTTQIQAHNQLLLDTQRYGEAYALINEAMHSKIAEGSKTAFGNLEQMTQSHQNTLKAIGKVAAIANIGIKTVESAMNIFAGFSTIPIVGYALGIAGAAAATVYGLEQMAQVQSMAEGGLITGGIPGKDSVPIMGMPGELVVPKQNFNEVVGAVANQRNGQGGTSGAIKVTVELKGNAARMLQVQAVQDQSMGTYRGT